MQQIDTDYYVQAHDFAPRQDMQEFAKKQGIEYPQYGGQLPIMRLYGVTAEGHSAVVHVHGYDPYFYVQAPKEINESICQEIAETLNRRMAERVDSSKKTNNGQYIRYVEIEYKQSIWNYRQEDFISTVWPQHVTTARSILENGIQISNLGNRTFLTYESNVVFVMRYMVDAGIVGANWITLPANQYLTRSNPNTTCQFEMDVMWQKLISHDPDGDWLKDCDLNAQIAPLRILSFDIECAGRKGCFPEPDKDPVIQGMDTPIVKNIFTLKSCAAISGAEVHSFEDESEMLQGWRDFVIACDPDILTGYNIVGFDIPYLMDRAKALKMGTRETNEISIDGRVIFDVMQVNVLGVYWLVLMLKSVCAKFLGEQKEDVHHSIISDLQNGDAESRRRLAVYCLKDAYLPQRLLDKLMFIYNYVEMARVTGVPIGWLLVRGQMLKVMSQLLRKARTKGLLLPNLKVESTDEKFEGAIVIEPKKGFYSCSHQLFSKEDLRTNKFNFTPDQITLTPHGDTFVKPTVKKAGADGRSGILPEILDELLAARKRAKADLKKATDPIMKAVLDGRQLALKVSANSVYGFTGAQVGKLPCLEISSSVTAFGREMIELTKAKVEAQYTVANGYKHDSVVVYGDTDSVMIKFGVTMDDAPEGEENRERWMIDETMKLALSAADFVNTSFVKPIKLEFEKVYYPYLLMNKKRYAALLWTNPDKFDKMDCKGRYNMARFQPILIVPKELKL
eukprot:765821-Hanusia_phi.AAC.6